MFRFYLRASPLCFLPVPTAFSYHGNHNPLFKFPTPKTIQSHQTFELISAAPNTTTPAILDRAPILILGFFIPSV
jgi:hypothetical protein